MILKRISCLVLSFCLLSTSLFCISPQEEDELKLIILELEDLNNEQKMILQQQEQTIKQQENRINSLEATTKELVNSSKELKKYWVLNTTIGSLAGLATGLIIGLVIKVNK